MAPGKKRWVIRDAHGRVLGPFSTERVLRQIDQGYYSGMEQVALYPGGDWIVISRAPEFYDRLLEALAQEGRKRQDTSTQQASSEPQPSTITPSGVRRGRVVRESADSDMPPAAPAKENIELSVEPPTPQQNSEIIELTDLKAASRKQKIQHTRAPLFLVTGAAALLLLAFLFQPSQPLSTRIHLVAPRKGGIELPKEKIQERTQRATAAFQRDTVDQYLRAQDELVGAVEGSAKNTAVRSYLCLVYRELWPFTYQDSQDVAVLNQVVQATKQLDPAGLDGATCEIVQLTLTGRFKEARNLIDTWLQLQPSAAVLYELRGDVFVALKDYMTAASYYEKARTLWPQWLKTSVQEARMRVLQKQNNSAHALFRAVLEQNPDHQVVRIEMGLLEMRGFHQTQRGYELIRAALESGQRLPSSVQAAGYWGLAEIYEQQSQLKQALDAAKQAYTLNPQNVAARQMILRLGGDKELKKSRPETREQLYVGDQYNKTGDCFAAQAEYKAVFEQDPKNGTAAMKAGRCLWQLNQSAEAVEWLNRAIKADPQLIPAYVLLADYHSQKYDFLAAVRVLQKAQSLQPRNHEVYRGYAQIELRRNNFKGAITFGQKALQLYDADPEAMLIMGQAHMGLQSFGEAQRYISRVIEMDINNVEAQGQYAKVLAGLQGSDAGAAYVRDLIHAYQSILEYRLILGEIYLQDERYTEAAEAFRQALSLEPDSKRALVQLGRAEQGQHQPTKALEAYLRAAVLDPTDANPIFYAGGIYLEQNKRNEAMAQYQRVLRINPRYPRAHLQMGRVHLLRQDSKSAIAEAEAEKALNPDLADVYILIAEAQFGLGQYAQCAAEYQKAVAKRAQDSGVYVKMGRCYRLSGALDSALSMLRQAETRESGNPDIYRELGAIYRMKNMGDEAITAFEKYLLLSPNASDRSEIEKQLRDVASGSN